MIGSSPRVASCMILGILASGVVLSLTEFSDPLHAQLIPDIQRTPEDQGKLEAMRLRQQRVRPAMGAEKFRQKIREVAPVPALKMPRQIAIQRIDRNRLSISITARRNGPPRLGLHFGNVSESVDSGWMNLKKALMDDAESKIKELATQHSLSKAQANKLRLAASLQVSQQERRFREWHDQYSGGENVQGIPRVRQAVAAVAVLNRDLQTYLDDEQSLFAKVLANLIDAKKHHPMTVVPE